jgi:hypothetical protein
MNEFWTITTAATIALATNAVLGWIYVRLLDRAKIQRPKRNFWDADPVRSFRITCSCGRECIVVWASALERYVAQEKGWTFGKHSWTCGRFGHHQKQSEMVSR